MAETGNVGSHTYPTAAGNIKKNGFVVLKGFPCKVMDVSISKVIKNHLSQSNTFLNQKKKHFPLKIKKIL